MLNVQAPADLGMATNQYNTLHGIRLPITRLVVGLVVAQAA